ncbi:alanine racemase [bacterium]|nr:alanine racemase [bacterium]
MVPQSYYRCWVEVDLDALRHNLQSIRHRSQPGAGVLGVVKADAYGHGLPQVARVLMEAGVDGFAVGSLTEALSLRQLGGTGWPILLFGSALPFEIAKLVEQQITPTLSTIEEARQFAAAAQTSGRPVGVQVEVDTGMGRVGFWHEEAAEQIATISTLPGLRLEGVYTHFPSADEDVEVTQRELECFRAVLRQLEERDVRVPRRHAANSAAFLHLPATHLDLVRPGLLLYGIQPATPRPAPAPAVSPTAAAADEFQPALSFKARVAFVKQIAAGRTISYGQTFVAPRPLAIATVTAGYSDGFNRILSNQAQVLVAGRRCPVVGRVTMDQIMVDVSAAPPVRCGDEVVFIGRQGAEEITATEVAGWAGTIAWDVLCGITKSARVPRVYHGLTAA